MKFIKTAIAGFAALGLSAGAALAEYPDRPITIVVSFAAGGNADVVQRLQAEALATNWAFQSMLKTAPVAHIFQQTMSVLEAEADGYTIFNWSPPSFMVVPLTRDVPYSPLEDFVPLFASISAQMLSMFGPIARMKRSRTSLRARAPKSCLWSQQPWRSAQLERGSIGRRIRVGIQHHRAKNCSCHNGGSDWGQVDVAVGQVASIYAYEGEVRP